MGRYPRGRIERLNFLSIEDEVRRMMNLFLPPGRGLFTADSFDGWIAASGNRKALFGITQVAYAALSPQQKGKARKEARDAVLRRIGHIVQRRHDCIHNCDRPAITPQNIGSVGSVRRVIDHVRYVVRKSDEHIEAEFPAFLKTLGLTGVTINGIGY